jgi:hypothetical protein
MNLSIRARQSLLVRFVATHTYLIRSSADCHVSEWVLCSTPKDVPRPLAAGDSALERRRRHSAKGFASSCLVELVSLLLSYRTVAQYL